MGTLSWMTQAGLKCNHLCPDRREARRGSHWRTEPGSREAAPGASDFSPEPPEGAQPCRHLHLRPENPFQT